MINLQDEKTRYMLMTPGPTQVRKNVRLARSLECTNPDLDEEFVEFYRDTCLLISQLLHTENETLILGGEGILGLEAACASLTEAGDRVLVVSNGEYGRGFADFVSMYGGIPTIYDVDEQQAIDVAALADFLKDHHDFKYATVVHCDTPTGVVNDVASICPLLKSYGILTLVDAVSSMFGEALCIDEAQIDIVCGGSQKVVSAPPGLTFVTISADAKAAMEARKTPIAAFYANLMTFKNYYEEKWFPYTMPISDIYGLRTAMENIKADEGILARHEKLAQATREALTKAGLSLFLESGHGATVTVFYVPEGTTDGAILSLMRQKHGIMLSGTFGGHKGELLRIGHMGENANEEALHRTFAALDDCFSQLGVTLQASLAQAFLQNL